MLSHHQTVPDLPFSLPLEIWPPPRNGLPWMHSLQTGAGRISKEPPHTDLVQQEHTEQSDMEAFELQLDESILGLSAFQR